MRLVFLGATLLLGAAGPAFADDIMANYFGNTVVAKGAMGEMHMHYRADHTFDANASNMMGSMTFKGSWKFDDKGQLCRVAVNGPPGMPNPLCTPWEAHKIGDTWTAPGRSATLVAGIK